nr:hypothetical protein [Tanacetum cinerariifolium]
MSSASSTVTYTSVYTDSEPERVFWGADEELSDEGLEEPQTPPAPQDEDEHEPMFIQPHDPNFVPEPIYPEYMPLEDKHILPAEEQPLPPIVSPTAESPGSSGNANVANAQRDGKETPKGNGCFECEASGHFKKDCPKLKNKNWENRNAQGWVYAVGNAEKNGNAPMNPDLNFVTGLPPARPVEF